MKKTDKDYVVWSDYSDEFISGKLDGSEALIDWVLDNSGMSDEEIDGMVIYELTPSKLHVIKKLEISES